MANLAQILKLSTSTKQIVLIGTPEVTSHTTSDNEPYYQVDLKEPVIVRCSTDPEIEAFQTDHVLIRESDLNRDDWKFVDEKKPEKGFFIEGWIVDFSKSHEEALYQPETIKKWLQESRNSKKVERNSRINSKILERMKASK